MKQSEFDALPTAQRLAMKNLHERSGLSWEEFLSRAHGPTSHDDYVGISDFHGMYVGIERDGYTHS